MIVKLISFDMDGTLLSSDFDTLVWDELIPAIYAEKKGVTLKEAKKFFAIEYSKDIAELDVSSKEWYDVNWWIKNYELNTTWEELWQKAQKNIFIFEDVKETLDELKKMGYKMIITSGASEEFIKIKLKDSQLRDYFEEIISASSKYNKHIKDGEVYERICEEYNIQPLELLHVGDSYVQDYQSPKSIGCQALFLDRNALKQDSKTIISLREVINFVKRINKIN